MNNILKVAGLSLEWIVHLKMMINVWLIPNGKMQLVCHNVKRWKQMAVIRKNVLLDILVHSILKYFGESEGYNKDVSTYKWSVNVYSDITY